MKHPANIAALAALGLLLVWGGLAARPAAAHEPHPGLNFSIGVRGVNGCNTRASDVTCTLPAASDFVVEVSLDTLPDDINSYGGFDIYMRYAGVTPRQDASTDDWQDCAFPASSYDRPGVVGMGCAIGIPPAGPSSYIGPLGTNTFTCGQNGSVSLAHSYAEGFTDLVENVTEVGKESVVLSHAEGAGTTETLTITCGQLPPNTPGVVTVGTPGPPGPTPGSVHTPVGGAPTAPGETGPTLEATAAAKATATARARPTTTGPAGDGDDGGGVDTWVWIVIAVGAVAAAGAAGAGGYWYMRSRGGGGGAANG